MILYLTLHHGICLFLVFKISNEIKRESRSIVSFVFFVCICLFFVFVFIFCIFCFGIIDHEGKERVIS